MWTENNNKQHRAIILFVTAFISIICWHLLTLHPLLYKRHGLVRLNQPPLPQQEPRSFALLSTLAHGTALPEIVLPRKAD